MEVKERKLKKAITELKLIVADCVSSVIRKGSKTCAMLNTA